MAAMDCTLALLADAANVSQEGKLNILGAFANINAHSFPASHPMMQLVLRFEASPAEVGQEKAIRVLLLDADGKAQGEAITANWLVPEPKSPGRRVQVQTVLRLVGTTFPKEGDYVVAILINGEAKAEVPLSLTLVPQETKADGS
jgi:hypothetical protein